MISKILKSKWQKTGGVGVNGERCLLLTLTHQHEEMSTAWYQDVERLAEIIKQRFPGRTEEISETQTVIKFNDHPETTFEDVEKVWEELCKS